MKEAIVEVMKFLFENEYDNIISSYDEGNKKSKRVHEKVGFEFYKNEKNSWQKNGIPIDRYILIMSKENFNKLYKSKTNTKGSKT